MEDDAHMIEEAKKLLLEDNARREKLFTEWINEGAVKFNCNVIAQYKIENDKILPFAIAKSN